jgi:Cys-rich protein (TIGR01571 family)
MCFVIFHKFDSGVFFLEKHYFILFYVSLEGVCIMIFFLLLTGMQNQPMWSTGLFDCCADVPMCCFTIFLPCFAFGRNAEALDGDKNSCWTAAALWWALQHTIALGCLYSSSYRGKLRSKYNIPEGPVPDSVIHCLCWPCAFCQEHREIHYRSFGPESWGQTFTIPPAQQEFHSSHMKHSDKVKSLSK